MNSTQLANRRAELRRQADQARNAVNNALFEQRRRVVFLYNNHDVTKAQEDAMIRDINNQADAAIAKINAWLEKELAAL